MVVGLVFFLGIGIPIIGIFSGLMTIIVLGEAYFIGGYSIIFGVIVLIVYFIYDSQNTNKLNQLIKEKNKLSMDILNTRVSTFKRDNGYEKSKIYNVNHDFGGKFVYENLWVYENFLLSIYSEDFYKFNTETVDGKFVKDLENGVNPSSLNLDERKLFLDDIEYFQINGDIVRTEKISGGGTSIGGAVVGAVVAGGVGAVIGSRKKIESETVTTDNRFILLVYKKNGKLTKEKFDFTKYNRVFEELIPEKEYSYVLSKK
jgi:hypothetical protein